MTKDIFKPNEEYKSFLQEIKEQVQYARIRASQTVNQTLITLYGNIGKEISEKQEIHGWGKSVVEQLSKDLKKEFNGEKGFSSSNLWYMRQIYMEYKNFPILQQLVGEIPWGQNLIIMSKVKTPEEREYYLKGTIKNGWTRNILQMQIEGNSYKHQVIDKKDHNFDETLLPVLAEQADKAMKSVYSLELLGIQKPVLEKEIERRMVNRIRDVMLELGQGFTFIGNQYRISTEEKEYFIDLLFFHRDLKCLIAMEIKAGDFKAEYIGKMNLYLNLLDEKEKREHENPSIGIILCKKKGKVEVEYALKGVQTPIQVSEYRLTKELPPELQGKLPKPEEIEAEIMQEFSDEEE